MEDAILTLLRAEAVGVRYGIVSEDEFKMGMKILIGDILGTRIEEWRYNDDGTVYGVPYPVEAFLAIKDGVHILIDALPHASRGDVSLFWRIGRLYEKVNGIKPRLIIFTFGIDEEAIKSARLLGVEVHVL